LSPGCASAPGVLPWVLIPLAQLSERLGDLDAKKPTIVYCAIGGRSRAAASILQDAGFDEPYNLKGGFHAWNGLSVEGPPEAGMAYFEGIDKPGDILALAWVLEEGSRRFYTEMAAFVEDSGAKKVYRGLQEVEKNHQKSISQLYYNITGTVSDAATPFYTQYLPEGEMEQLMEGQMKLNDVLAWTRKSPLKEVLEYSLTLEAKLYDLYFRLERKHLEPTINNIYAALATEEKSHLDLFTDLLAKHL
jgi:rubrerythrin